jgi:galactose mutarotase-like enzyme
MSDDDSSRIRLYSRDLSAEISPLGAQLSVLRDRAVRDLLWNGDPAVWAGRAPLLFPIVGALAGGRYRIGSKTYALSRHGFARNRRFDVLEATPVHALFRLKADETTLAVYPFVFALEIRFEVKETTLAVTALVRNNGDTEMPASFGFHPAFRWPLPFDKPRASHYLEFEADEPAPVRRLNPQGLLTPERHITPVQGRRLPLDDALFVDDALIFDTIRSRSVTYGAEEGPRIRVSYANAPYLGVWTKPRANFICIEPWHGIADPEGFDGDFAHKPGTLLVPAGAVAEVKMEITLTAA